jgi:hypothetical protein
VSTSAVEEILGQLPIDQLAAQLGVDRDTVARAAAAAIPSLIGGLQHNADQGDEQAVAAALAQHGASPLLEADTVDLNDVDTADGAKIVQHIFGDQSTQLSHAIGQKTGASGSLVNQLLPILAPIVLAYLAKKLSGSPQSGGGTGGILAGILGGVLGEQTATATGAHTSGSSSVLGNILGGILSGGGLHSILGGVQAQNTASTTQEPTTYETQPDQTSYDPQQGSVENSGTIPAAEAGSVAVDETPAAPAEEQSQEQAPQSSSSIVDEILGGLFGKR